MHKLVISLIAALVSGSAVGACDSSPPEMYDVEIRADGDEVVLEDGDGEQVTILLSELQGDGPIGNPAPTDAILAIPRTVNKAVCCQTCSCNPNGCACKDCKAEFCKEK